MSLIQTPSPYGRGEQFVLRDGRTRLEVFPDSSVTRLTGQDIRVELFRSPAPVVQGAEVMVAQGSRDLTNHEATLSLTETGGVIFTYVAEAPESPQTAERDPGDASDLGKPSAWGRRALSGRNGGRRQRREINCQYPRRFAQPRG